MREQRAALGGVAVAVAAAVVALQPLAACGAFTEAPAAGAGDGGVTDASSSDGDIGEGSVAEPEQDAMTAMPAGVIVANETKLGRLAVGPSNVYYTQDLPQGAVMRVDKKATNASATSFAPNVGATALALAGSTLYATSRSNDRILALDASQSGVPTKTKTVSAPTAVVADAAAVVFLQTAVNTGAFSLAPDFASAPLVLTAGAEPGAAAMDAQTAYATFGPRVRRYTRAGGITVASGTASGPISVVEVGGDTLYMASGSVVMTLPALFGTVSIPTKLHDYGSGAEVTAIRATDAEIFVATQGATNGGTVHRLPLPGAASTVPPSVVSRFTDADCRLPDMVVDDTSIYFLCNSAAGVGSVRRVARPVK